MDAKTVGETGRMRLAASQACRCRRLERAGFYQDLPYACTHDSAPILKDIEARAGRGMGERNTR